MNWHEQIEVLGDIGLVSLHQFKVLGENRWNLTVKIDQGGEDDDAVNSKFEVDFTSPSLETCVSKVFNRVKALMEN